MSKRILKAQAIMVVGAQWGDEGKGKVIDFLAPTVDYVVRFQGGNNAGHTVVVDGVVHKLHLLPSGVLYAKKRIVLGNGMVIDPEVLLSELDNFETKGFKLNLLISERAHVIFPFHIIMDGMIDDYKGVLGAGTTRRGIGPAYADKAERFGIRMVDLLNKKIFREKFDQLFELKKNTLQKLYQQRIPLHKETIFQTYYKFGQRLKPYIGDVSLEVNRALDSGKRILFEGAQGTLLDNDHGAYPHTTSSNTIAGAVCTGVGIGPTKIDEIIGVVKAYLSRVGSGPVPTEAKGSMGDYLRERGQEYGTTTGRPRRCGWIDLVQLNYAARINGLTSLAVTKIDVLGGLKNIPVAIKYRYKSSLLTELPADLEVMRHCRPVYKALPGWKNLTDADFTTIITHGYKALPKHMKDYLAFIADQVNTPVSLVSVGAERKATIQVP
ncbi:MAG: adenylosuccinate synthase [Patescibacteria group bacterium]|jgi:adenylosuccinate synthase